MIAGLRRKPHGDTFSLEDVVLCFNKGAKEVRAVTISCESPETMALKSYRCEMLDTPGFNTEGRMNLLNAFYKYFANGAEIETGLEPYKIGRDSLRFRENEFSVLGAVGLVNFHGSCDYSLLAIPHIPFKMKVSRFIRLIVSDPRTTSLPPEAKKRVESVRLG